MKWMQRFAMVGKSSATVTLKALDVTASKFEPAPPDATSNPIYLKVNKIVLTTALATADPTFWSSPGYYRVIIERIT